MRQNSTPDLEDCMHKIEALLKEYNCKFCIDKELGGKLTLVDVDTLMFTEVFAVFIYEDF